MTFHRYRYNSRIEAMYDADHAWIRVSDATDSCLIPLDREAAEDIIEKLQEFILELDKPGEVRREEEAEEAVERAEELARDQREIVAAMHRVASGGNVKG